MPIGNLNRNMWISALAFDTLRISFFYRPGKNSPWLRPWTRCFGCRYICLCFFYHPKKNFPWIRHWEEVYGSPLPGGKNNPACQKCDIKLPRPTESGTKLIFLSIEIRAADWKLTPRFFAIMAKFIWPTENWRQADFP